MQPFQYQVPGPPIHMSRGVQAAEPTERGPKMYSGFHSCFAFYFVEVFVCLCTTFIDYSKIYFSLNGKYFQDI